MATGEEVTSAGRRWRVPASGLAGLFFGAAGLLHAVAFPPLDLPEAAYVFALPILLWGLFRDKVRGEGVLLYGAGFLSWAILLGWLRNVTDHLEFPLAGLLGWLALLALAAVLALFWWGWGLAALWTMRRVRWGGAVVRLAAMVGLAAGWVVLEWLRGWVAGGFPWLPLGASQWQRALLLQVVSLGGAGALGFVLILFNVGLSLYLQRLWRFRRGRWWQRISPEFYVAIGLLLGAVGYGLSTAGLATTERVKGPRLGFVQPNAGVVEKWDNALTRRNLKTLTDLTLYGRYLGAEVILWPETPAPGRVWGTAWLRDYVEGLSRDAGVPILLGALVGDGGETSPLYNGVVWVSPETGLWAEGFYAKRKLVPFGEYIPMAEWLPFIEGLVPQSGQFSAGEEAVLLPIETVGSGASAEENGEERAGFRRTRAGPLVCYEDVFSRLALANVQAGADWHYVATNNAWFGEEGGAYQHAAHSVLRAVETRRPVVRCGNAGWSGWIDEYGQIQHVVVDESGTIYFQGVDVAEFSLSAYWRNRDSFYVKAFSWFPLLWIGLVGIGGGIVLLGNGLGNPGKPEKAD